MNVFKHSVKWIGIVMGVLISIVIAQIGWGMYREPIGKKNAMDFCATVKVGQSIEGIQERAIESGAAKAFAKWKTDADGSQTMLVIFVGTPPFSRHICSIKATKIVTSAEYSHMD